MIKSSSGCREEMWALVGVASVDEIAEERLDDILAPKESREHI